jgi:adenine-specific DNA-methyltransferase
MKRLTPASPELTSADLTVENREKIKAAFPDALASDGKIDFDVLRELLGDAVDEVEERYGLNWHGKRAARRLALTPSTAALRPCPEDSLDWDTTQNIFIEGDNLEALKLLQKSYAGKVKLIYIDPPYNTGKDFVYPDNFRDSIANYLEITGQVEDGQRIASNAEASGRFHTDWLNMIYPRLKLAHSLLRRDGVLMCSIGNEEIHNLRSVCDDIFGADNFCGIFIWEKKKKPSFLDRNMGTVTDYIVVYARNRPESPEFIAGTVEDGKKYPFNNAGNPLATLAFPANAVEFKCGDMTIPPQDMSEGNIKTRLLDEVVVVGGRNAGPFRLDGEWRYSQAKLDEFVQAGAEIVISKVPFRPNYVNRSGEAKKTANLLSYRVNDVATNEDATDELRALFGCDIFTYPKPTGLLAYLIRAVTGGTDLIMDFFAGSGTTAHATLLQNQADGGQRRCISIQLPEPLNEEDAGDAVAVKFLKDAKRPLAISELTKERLRRATRAVRSTLAAGDLDAGFRVFKLATGNLLPWEATPQTVKESLSAAVDHVRPDRTDDDLFYDVILKHGLDICLPVEERSIAGHVVRAVAGGAVFACLGPRIGIADVEQLAEGIAAWRTELSPANPSECRVVFRDAAFESDVAKANLAAILKQRGFDENLVVSL